MVIASATTATAASPWLPVIAAAVGAGTALIVGVVTQLWTGHRENVRWSREQQDREDQWQREDQARRDQWQREREDRQQQWQREDAQRWLQDRQQIYARLMAALDEWDVAVDNAVAQRHADALTGESREYDSTEWDELRRAARAAQGLVELMAPESVRGLARSAVVRRQAIWMLYLTVEDADLSKMDEERSTVRKVTRDLRDAMRGDLGLGPEDDPGPRQTGGGSG
jgi:hypothetical protein